MAKKQNDENNEKFENIKTDNINDCNETIDNSDTIKPQDANLVDEDPIIIGLNARINEYKLTAQRIQAEFENYRKRNDEAKKSLRFEVTNDVLLDFLKVLDSINCALNMVKEDSLKEGLVLIAKQFNSLLFNYEVIEIDPINQKFDPNFHHAIMQINDKDNIGNIVEVYQKGYVRKDKVLRYATVKVAI